MNLSRAGGPAVRIAHFPAALATWLGCMGLAILGAWAAFQRLADHLLWYGALTLCFMAALSLVSIGAGALWVWSRLRRGHAFPRELLVMECGQEARLPGEIPVSPLWPPVTCEVRWTEPVMRGTRHQRGRSLATPVARGWHDRIQRDLRIEDPVGLLSLSFKTAEAGAVMVLPARRSWQGDWSELPLLRGETLAAPGALRQGDPFDLRDYRDGDSARRIIWRIVARTGGEKFVIRTPEEAATMTRACFFLAAENDEAGAELARCLVEESDNSSPWWLMTAGTDGDLAGGGDHERALALICRSAAAQTQDDGVLAQDLEKFRAEVLRQVPGAVVVVAGQPAEGRSSWISKVKLAARILQEHSPMLLVGRAAGASPLTQCEFEGDFSRVWEIEMISPDLEGAEP